MAHIAPVEERTLAASPPPPRSSGLFRSCETDLSLRREIRKGSLASGVHSRRGSRFRNTWSRPCKGDTRRFGTISLVASRALYFLSSCRGHWRITGSARKMSTRSRLACSFPLSAGQSPLNIATRYYLARFKRRFAPLYHFGGRCEPPL